jgi:hypothetical protein
MGEFLLLLGALGLLLKTNGFPLAWVGFTSVPILLRSRLCTSGPTRPDSAGP